MQETNGGIMISKNVLKSDVWPGSEKCWFNPKFEDNDLKSGCYRISKLPPLSVNYVCPISQKTNHPIMIPKIVLKSVLWRGSESALTCCIFQLLCFSLHPISQWHLKSLCREVFVFWCFKIKVVFDLLPHLWCNILILSIYGKENLQHCLCRSRMRLVGRETDWYL